MNQRKKRVEEIFQAALELGSPEERASFLQKECAGEPDLQAEVEELLKASAAAEPVFQPHEAAMASSRLAAPDLATQQPGSFIGRYKLLQKIGEGGMGVVYMAEQEEPVRRRVALKIIKLGMDTKLVVARFEAERQALALMDHPNIARVLDGGATETGRPYFVMELVQGVPITEFCDKNHLSTEQRLKLFIPVCQAIQSAHQKGIIHRDLKPTNILVTLNPDGSGFPKVIDFGVAKATSQKLTEKTLFTAHGMMVGTPAYMSPEQAEMSHLDVDTRADIYSLGALLYDLLTGSPPFPEQRLRSAGYNEMQRIILEEQPERPSTRLTRNLMARKVEASTQSKFKIQNSKIGDDLDWIVMKCLEKDRARRYETANGLSRDLERHLRNEPITARPPSRLYEFQKTVRRHWVGFAAVGGVLIALAIGVMVSTFQTVRARQAERHGQKLLYAAKMGLVQAAWDHNRVAQVRELLEETAGYPDRGFEWYYWQRQAHLELKTLHGHLAGVNAVAFSPDGKRIVTGSSDTTAKVWDAVTGNELFSLTGHLHNVDSVAFSPDGRWIATGSHDTTARIWHAQSGKLLLTLQGHTVAFSPDSHRVVTGSLDGTEKIWDADSGDQLLVLTGHTDAVNDVAFSPDGRQIASGSQDGTARVWNALTGKELLRFEGHSNAVLCVAFSPDGQRIVTGSDDRDPTARVWEAATGKVLLVLTGHSSRINTVGFRSDGQRIATASDDQTAKVWDAATGKLLFTIKGHGDRVNDIAFSLNGARLVTGSSDHTAKVWDASGDRSVLTLEGHENTVLSAAFSPDGQRIATSSADHTAKVWEAATGKLLATLQGRHTEPVGRLVFSPDGQRIVTGSRDQLAVVWEADSGRSLFALQGHSGPVLRVAFSPNGQLIATGSADRTCRLWEAASGKNLRTLKEHSGGVIGLAFSRDGRRLFTGSADQTAKVWDVASGRVLSSLKVHDETLQNMTFSADGQRIVTGSTDGMAMIWEAAGAQNPLHLKGHSGGVFSLRFSPDERRILTASTDGTAKVWDAASGVELLSLHDTPFYVAAFSPDGRRIVTGGNPASAKVWNSATTEQSAAWEAEEKSATERLAALSRERAAAEQRARAASIDDPGAIKEWLILGPIGFDGSDGAKALAQEQIADEAQRRPSAGDRIRVDARDWLWQEVRLRDYLIDFRQVSRAMGRSFVAYAVCYIESKANRSGLMIKVSSEGQSRIYLNGKQIYRWEKPRKYVPDQDVATAELKAGLNTLVFKVVKESEGCRASLRFTDAAGQPVNGIQVTLTPPP